MTAFTETGRSAKSVLVPLCGQTGLMLAQRNIVRWSAKVFETAAAFSTISQIRTFKAETQAEIQTSH